MSVGFLSLAPPFRWVRLVRLVRLVPLVPLVLRLKVLGLLCDRFRDSDRLVFFFDKAIYIMTQDLNLQLCLQYKCTIELSIDIDGGV